MWCYWLRTSPPSVSHSGHSGTRPTITFNTSTHCFRSVELSQKKSICSPFENVIRILFLTEQYKLSLSKLLLEFRLLAISDDIDMRDEVIDPGLVPGCKSLSVGGSISIISSTCGSWEC